jgi:hypothetical protein
MFPVTRQVRRKRTRVFGRRGSTRREQARARGSAGESRRGELRSTRTKGGLGGETGWARGETGWARGRAGWGSGGEQGWAWEREVGLGRDKAGFAGAKGRPGEKASSPDTQTHRWPPDGHAAHPGQRCDPAGPAAVTEMPGPIRWDTASWSPL